MKEYSNDVDLRRWIRELKRYRRLYVVSIVLFMGVAILYYMRSIPLYTAEAVMLIEDPTDKVTPPTGGGQSIMRMFSIGGFGSSSVDNELAIIKSNELREKVIRKLGLNYTYIERDGLSKKVLFNESPVKVEASASVLDNLRRGFVIKIKLSNGKISATAVSGRIFKKKFAEIKDATLPCVLDTEYGKFNILATSTYTPEISEKLDVTVGRTLVISENLGESLKVNIDNLKADAISLKIKEANSDKAMAILNAVMAAYNEKRLERRRNVAQEEVDYYTGRLNSLFVDLNEAESRMEEFKSVNKLTGIGAEAETLVGKAMSGQEEITKLKALLTYYNEVLGSLKGNLDSHVLIPVVEGFGNPMIAEYNKAVIERKQLVLSATPENVALKMLDENLAALRKSIIQNAEGIIAESQNQLSTIEKSTSRAVSRLDKMPRYEREYQNLFRDQSLKNELYVFLLQKRESAELKLLSNSTLGFIVDEAYVESKPKNTKAMIVCLAAFVLSLLLPTLLILFLMQWHNRVYDALDLSSPELKKRSYKCDGSARSMGEAMWRITDGMKRHVVYVAAYGCDTLEICDKLTASTNEMGYRAEVLKSSSGHTYSLLTAGFLENIDRMTSGGVVAVIPVPDESNIAILNDNLREQDATLAMVVSCDSMTRKQLNELTEPFDPEHLYMLFIRS